MPKEFYDNIKITKKYSIVSQKRKKKKKKNSFQPTSQLIPSSADCADCIEDCDYVSRLRNKGNASDRTQG